MTYRPTRQPAGTPPALLRRPADIDSHRTVTSAPAPGTPGELPGFLRAAQRRKEWTAPGTPVRINGFDPREDILTVEFDRTGSLPRLTIETDDARAVTALLADGMPLAILRLATNGFSLDHVAITHTRRGRDA